MKLFLKILFEYTVLLIIGGAVYYCVELLWRGHSHYAMGIVGGIAFIFIGMVNSRYLEWEMPFVEQMFISGFVITAIEFVAGLILNVWLKLDIWDYSDVKYNLLGQVCLSYFALWQFLSAPGIILHDVICWKLFGDRKPAYKII